MAEFTLVVLTLSLQLEQSESTTNMSRALRTTIKLRRAFTTSLKSELSSFNRHQALSNSALGPNVEASASSASTTSTSSRNANANAPLRFYGNTDGSVTSRDRMKDVFGTRLEDGGRLSSSRRDANEPVLIAGVLVPHRPAEPDNCCMSGCVNCVWEQYNDDIRDWRMKRRLATEAISKTEDHWPADLDPPLKSLDFKNVPKELRAKKRKLASAKKISTSSYFPAVGKPGAQNLKLEVPDEDADDDWSNVPVQFKVFAETEKLMKQKRKERLEKLKAQQIQV